MAAAAAGFAVVAGTAVGVMTVSRDSDVPSASKPLELPASLDGHPRIEEPLVPGFLSSWWPGKAKALGRYPMPGVIVVNVLAVRGRFGDKGDLQVGTRFGGTLTHVGPHTCVESISMVTCGRETDDLSVSVLILKNGTRERAIALADEVWADLT